MASKSTISMEELKLQLADSLPGAVGIAARAMGMTERAFRDATKAGEIMAYDFLPKFAAQIKKELGGSAEDASRQAQSWFNRFNNSMTGLADTIGDVLNPALADLAKAFIPIVENVDLGIKRLAAMRGEIALMGKEELVIRLASNLEEQKGLEKAAYGKGQITSPIKNYFTDKEVTKLAKENVEILKRIKYLDILAGKEKKQDFTKKPESPEIDEKTLEKARKEREKAYRAAIEMLQAQSAKELAVNDYTDSQVLNKQKQLEEKKLGIMREYGKQGTVDYIEQEARIAEAEKAIDKQVNENAEENLDRSLARRLAKSDLSRLEEANATFENERLKLAIYEKGTQDYIEQQNRIDEARNRVMEAMLDDHKKAQEEIKKTAEDFSSAIASNLRNLAEGTTSFGNLYKKIMLDIAETQVKSGIMNLFKGSPAEGYSLGGGGNTLTSGATKGDGYKIPGGFLGGIVDLFKGLGRSYDSGGIVPGSFMQPQLAIVHGKEKVLRPWDAGYNGNDGQGSSESDVYIFNAPIQTAADANQVLEAIDKNKHAFLGWLKTQKKRNPNSF